MSKQRILCFLVFISCICQIEIIGQPNSEKLKKAEVSYAVHLGITTPKPSPLSIFHEKMRGQRADKKRLKPVPNFPGRGKTQHEVYPAPPFGEDPVRQSAEIREGGFTPNIQVNVDGINSNFAGSGVPDANGDIGDEYYVQCVNSSYYQVFEKNGLKIGSPVDFNTLWAPLGFTSRGDPVIIFDQEFKRWIITEFPSGNQLLIAISMTNDPLGDYHVYNFGTPNFPDYPKYAIWKNTIYLTTNERGASRHHAYFLDRAALMNGDPTVMIQRFEIPGVDNAPGFMVATPIDWSGHIAPPTDAHPMVMYIQDDAWGEVAQDEIEIFSFDIDFNSPSNSSWVQSSLLTAPFDSEACSASGFGFSCIPQPSNFGIDGIPYVLMHQTHYRNFGSHESIVLNFIVDITGSNDPIAGIRWMELRRVNSSDPWSVYQEGTYGPDDGLHRFIGTIAMDGVGNIGLTYNFSSSTVFPGLAFTGRRDTDPLGMMTADETILANGRSSVSSDRFGDYSSLAVDPMDDRTFWFTGEYMRDNNSWGTKVAAFKLSRDTVDISPVNLISPMNSADLSNQEIVRVEIKNLGLTTIQEFNVGFQLNGNTQIVDAVTTTLSSDSSYIHEFSITADLSLKGSYNFNVFTELIDDTNSSNDALFRTVAHLPNIDVGPTQTGQFNTIICESSILLQPEITNFGFDTIHSVQIIIVLNEMSFDTITIMGIAPFQSALTTNYRLNNLISGLNTIQLISSLPNSGQDENNTNDTLSFNINVNTFGSLITLSLQPDDLPDETTWELRETSGNLLLSGGPYTSSDLITETWCLAQACYFFTIFDAAGDGICCTFGSGSYEILNEDLDALVSSIGSFGSQERSTFCVDACAVSAEVNTISASSTAAMDGVIMISASNGQLPFRFSIDGGQTFQFINTYSNLSAGLYFITVLDQRNCFYRDTVTVSTCDLEVLVTSTSTSGSGAEDGSLSFSVQGSRPPWTFSIDGGLSFRSDSLFENVAAAYYHVVVQDSLGCIYQNDSVLVDENVAAHETEYGQSFHVFPNPNNGRFSIEIKGYDGSSVFLLYHIYNTQGKLILADQLVKYDNRYIGEITIERQDDGIYYVNFPKSGMTRMIRIIKM